MVVNEKVKTDYIRLYDKHGNLDKLKIIKNGETAIRNFVYTYDSNNNVVSYEYETTSKGEKRLEEYKYNKDGNKIQRMYTEGKSKRKVVNKYKGKKLTAVHLFKIDSNQKEKLISIKTYDKYNNHLSSEIYRNSVLHYEVKNEFIFDDKDNWVEKRHYNKYKNKGPKMFKLRSIQTREISYWD